MEPLALHRRGFAEDPAFDMAVSAALLQAVAGGSRPASLRLHEAGDALAFSVRDRLHPRFTRAVELARGLGFPPILRLAGGRAALFHRETLAVAWALPAPEGSAAIARRSDELAARIARALGALGVDARVGEVPGEYCPGPHSVNARGRRKLVGLGQRLVRGGVYVGGVLVVGGAQRVRDTLVPIYRELGLPFDPESAGGVEEEVPGVRCKDVADALLREFASAYALEEQDYPAELLARAREREPRHAVG